MRPHEVDGNMPNDLTIRAPFMNPKPRRALEDRSETPLSATRALFPARKRGRVMDGRLPGMGGGALRALQWPC